MKSFIVHYIPSRIIIKVMDNPVGQTLEKIKLQEQNTEIKLREKRELNNTIISLHRAIRDSTSQLGQLCKEHVSLTETTDKLLARLEVEKTRRNALTDQLNSCCKEQEELRNASSEGVTAVWNKRSKLFETVQGIADKCDIWALLIKPTCNETIPCVKTYDSYEIKHELVRNDERLKHAIERRNKILAERDRLLSEPEIGEETPTRFYKGRRSFSSELKSSENEPIKFSTSPAARKAVATVFKRVDTTMPWYQPYSVIGSVAVFLIYFCVFREENDIDQEFNKTLYDRIKGLEKEQLLQSYRFNKEHGKSVEDIEKRLQEIELAEKKLVA
ncbi:unnamed protein product [Chrysodeixis includens]|uniref:Uncharacterized protein n=1 Tax=Chrysodeixis includens TaxID=689277 RepID=A0A9N8KS39_CHRIL|nr:unnamed protein product [Chrysodeixis includens]